MYTFQTVEHARAYYACEDLEGVLLENEGGSSTSRYSIVVHYKIQYIYLAELRCYML